MKAAEAASAAAAEAAKKSEAEKKATLQVGLGTPFYPCFRDPPA